MCSKVVWSPDFSTSMIRLMLDANMLDVNNTIADKLLYQFLFDTVGFKHYIYVDDLRTFHNLFVVVTRNGQGFGTSRHSKHFLPCQDLRNGTIINTVGQGTKTPVLL